MLLESLQWERWCPMCGTDGAWGGAMMGLMMLFWLVVIATIGWLIYRSTLTRSPGGSPPPQEPAEEVLKRRYARGEIDRDSYLRMLSDLERETHGRTT